MGRSLGESCLFEVGREGCERGWWREGEREVLESLFATIAGSRVARGRDAPVCCSLGLVFGLLGWLHVARSGFPLRRRAGG